jgi:hypothetical protein
MWKSGEIPKWWWATSRENSKLRGNMIKYLDKVHECQSYFDRVVLTKILREDNVQVDALSKVGSGTDQDIEVSAHEVIIKSEPSIAPKQDVM